MEGSVSNRQLPSPCTHRPQQKFLVLSVGLSKVAIGGSDWSRLAFELHLQLLEVKMSMGSVGLSV